MSFNIETLLELLCSEFAAEGPAALEAVEAWRTNPGDGSAQAAVLGDMLERCTGACAVLGLEGLASYLGIVHASLAPQVAAPEPGYLDWLSAWHGLAADYLAAPVDAATTELVVAHIAASPAAPDTGALERIAALLATPPSLPLDEQEAASLRDATAEDVMVSGSDVDEGLLAALLNDAPAQLDQLADIVEAGIRGAIDAHGLREAQRTAHTLKGSALIVGIVGVGNLAHRIEDLIEFAVERATADAPLPAAMMPDIAAAIDTLQQMIDHLQGNDTQPQEACAVLQRMIEWTRAIQAGNADLAVFAPLSGAPVPAARTPLAPVAGGTQPVRASAVSQPEAVPAPAPSAIAPAVDSAAMRVDVERVGRFVRRAGQDIVRSERLGAMMRDAVGHLQQVEASHMQLTTRLRELELVVGRQVVQLREREGGLDPLEMDRYDTLHTLARLIAEAAGDKQALARAASKELTRAGSLLHQQVYSQKDQHRELLETRLVPVRSIIQRLKRNVQQTAAATGKRVCLEIAGEDTRLDADILGRLTEPLLHLLRNAVDHGIETPELRLAAGKPEEGSVRIAFRRDGRDLEVVCVDDGRGLDHEAIRLRAIEDGLVPEGRVLTPEEACRLILLPGFSTRGSVTEISGRGVGMDVVNDRVTALKGHLRITTRVGQGTTFGIRLPASSGYAHALVVRSGGQLVALPLEQVSSVLPPGAPVPDGCRTIRLADWLGWPVDDAVAGVQLPRVLLRAADEIVAAEVEQVVASRELILQDVGRLARRVSGVVAGSVLESGAAIVLVDAAALELTALSGPTALATAALIRRLKTRKTRILVVDDALTVRAAMAQLLEDNGYEPVLAADGFDALDRLKAGGCELVLTDLEMPNLNGLDLTRRIRATPEWAGLPVVMVTSRSSGRHRDLGIEAGVDLYMTKPYSDNDLLAQVRRLLVASRDGSRAKSEDAASGAAPVAATAA